MGKALGPRQSQTLDALEPRFSKEEGEVHPGVTPPADMCGPAGLW